MYYIIQYYCSVSIRLKQRETWYQLKVWYYSTVPCQYSNDRILPCISITFWSHHLKREFIYDQARAEFWRQCVALLPPNIKFTAEPTVSHLGGLNWGTSLFQYLQYAEGTMSLSLLMVPIKSMERVECPAIPLEESQKPSGKSQQLWLRCVC